MFNRWKIYFAVNSRGSFWGFHRLIWKANQSVAWTISLLLSVKSGRLNRHPDNYHGDKSIGIYIQSGLLTNSATVSVRVNINNSTKVYSHEIHLIRDWVHFRSDAGSMWLNFNVHFKLVCHSSGPPSINHWNAHHAHQPTQKFVDVGNVL